MARLYIRLCGGPCWVGVHLLSTVCEFPAVAKPSHKPDHLEEWTSRGTQSLWDVSTPAQRPVATGHFADTTECRLDKAECVLFSASQHASTISRLRVFFSISRLRQHLKQNLTTSRCLPSSHEVTSLALSIYWNPNSNSWVTQRFGKSFDLSFDLTSWFNPHQTNLNPALKRWFDIFCQSHFLLWHQSALCLNVG